MSYTRALDDISADVSIRVTGSGDPSAAAEAARLAALDSAPVPEAPYLVASSGGRAIALRSLATGDTVADPFERTAEVLRLLELRAAQLQRATSSTGRVIGLRRRLGLRVI